MKRYGYDYTIGELTGSFAVRALNKASADNLIRKSIERALFNIGVNIADMELTITKEHDPEGGEPETEFTMPEKTPEFSPDYDAKPIDKPSEGFNFARWPFRGEPGKWHYVEYEGAADGMDTLCGKVSIKKKDLARAEVKAYIKQPNKMCGKCKREMKRRMKHGGDSASEAEPKKKRTRKSKVQDDAPAKKTKRTRKTKKGKK